MLLVNHKTYKASSGGEAVKLAGYLLEAGGKYNIRTVACPQFADLKEVAKILPEGAWAQHVDFVERGRATGWTPPEIVKDAGAVGVILNHSEHKLSYEDLGKTVEKVRNLGLEVLIFADSLEESIEVAKFKPNWIGYEPPELVASKDTSVAKAKPEIIEKVVNAIPNTPILVGAGIKDVEDVRVSLKLGAKGIGVASAVVLALDPNEVIENLASGFRL